MKETRTNVKKINKSDIIIYILAIIAFILMIVVLTKKNYIKNGNNTSDKVQINTKSEENIKIDKIKLLSEIENDDEQNSKKMYSNKEIQNFISSLNSIHFNLSSFNLHKKYSFFKDFIIALNNYENYEINQNKKNINKVDSNNVESNNEENIFNLVQINENPNLENNESKKKIDKEIKDNNLNKNEIKKEESNILKEKKGKENNNKILINNSINEKNNENHSGEKNNLNVTKKDVNNDKDKKQNSINSNETENVEKKRLSYKVVKGDCLWKIAERYNVKTEELIKTNKQIKNPNLIIPGQIVYIPINKTNTI